jgi:hypothetical protein
VNPVAILSPLRGSRFATTSPTAHAVGYDLSPLRGWDKPFANQVAVLVSDMGKVVIWV